MTRRRDESELDLTGACALLGMSPSWIYKHTAAGTIPHTKRGKYLRFDAGTVVAWFVAMYAACPR